MQTSPKNSSIRNRGPKKFEYVAYLVLYHILTVPVTFLALMRVRGWVLHLTRAAYVNYVCVALMAGYPVALTLGGVSLGFALLGHALGAMDIGLLYAFLILREVGHGPPGAAAAGAAPPATLETRHV